MRPKFLLSLTMAGIAISLSAWFLWASSKPPEEREPTPSPDTEPRDTRPPQSLSDAPNRPPLFNLQAKDGKTLELSFDLAALNRARTISYLDPATGERLTTTLLTRERGLGAASLLGAVPLEGQNRPATITLGDEGTVMLTLPYSGGVLSGEGVGNASGLGTVTLRKAAPFKDAVRQRAENFLPSAPREPQPSCVNCL